MVRRMGKETVEGKKDMVSSRGGGGWETLGGGGGRKGQVAIGVDERRQKK